MALAGEWKAGGEGGVAEFLAVVFEQDERIETVEFGTAVAEHDIEVAVVIEIAEAAAHGAPAAGDAEFLVDLRECAVAIVVIDAHGLAVGRPFAMAQSVDDIVVIGPDELADIHPAIVVVIPEEGR